jgi:hypothetical protein
LSPGPPGQRRIIISLPSDKYRHSERIEVYILFFINVQMRRVHIAGLTTQPDRAWVAQQARNTAMFFAEQKVKPATLLRDNDGKFGAEFDAVFAAEGVAVKRRRVKLLSLTAIGPGGRGLRRHCHRLVQALDSPSSRPEAMFVATAASGPS